MNYKILEWDSAILNTPTAIINNPLETPESLANTLEHLRNIGIRLVYWPATENCENSVLKDFHGRLVDKKTTLITNLQAIQPTQNELYDLISPYKSSSPNKDLEHLAIQSGAASRFATDPNLPQESLEKIYLAWIKNSVAKEICSETLVLKIDNTICGFITLGEKNQRGDIGLIAVDAAARGKGYGKQLIRAAQNWFIKKNYTLGQVVTQGDNKAALNLYASCGYSIESSQQYYHFWLTEK